MLIEHPGQHCEGYTGGRYDARSVNVQYNIIRGDQWNESDLDFKEPVKNFKGAVGSKEQSQEFQEPVNGFKGLRETRSISRSPRSQTRGSRSQSRS